MYRKIFVLLVFVSFGVHTKLFAQPVLWPLAQDFTQTALRNANMQHTGFKPLLTDVGGFGADTLMFRKSTDRLLPRSWYNSWFWRKLRNDDFAIMQKDSQYRVVFNPLLQLEMGPDRAEGVQHSVNTRAVMLQGSVGKRVAFYSAFYENQAYYPAYIDTVAHDYGVIPGLGSPKLFGEDGHDFSRAEAWLSFRIASWLSVQMGHGRNQLGDGYRSMLLSDGTFPYPYLRLNLGKKRWQLTAMFAQFVDFMDQDKQGRVWHYNYHYKRHFSMTYLSYKPNKRLELGLFEGIMWHSTDTASGVYNKIDKAFFSPIPLIRTLTYGLADNNNVLLGLNANYRLFPSVLLYGQLAVDDLDVSNIQGLHQKLGGQVGFRYFDVLGLKGSYLQAEYNMARPFTYSASNVRSNWTHYNLPLAHPLGANFGELVLIGRLSWKDWRLEAKLIDARIGGDTPTEFYGNSLFRSDATAMLSDAGLAAWMQGEANRLQYLEGKLAFVINPRTQLQLYLHYISRKFNTPDGTQTNDYIGFGVRTALYNQFFDF